MQYQMQAPFAAAALHVDCAVLRLRGPAGGEGRRREARPGQARDSSTCHRGPSHEEGPRSMRHGEHLEEGARLGDYRKRAAEGDVVCDGRGSHQPLRLPGSG